MTAPEAKIVQWRPADGPTRRIEFEPFGDGRYLRKERYWAGCRWRTTGTEVVEELHVGTDADPELSTNGHSYAGP